jgi:hypothetical protein
LKRLPKRAAVITALQARVGRAGLFISLHIFGPHLLLSISLKVGQKKFTLQVSLVFIEVIEQRKNLRVVQSLDGAL